MLYNKERAVSVMEEYGVDALVATLPENVYYFTGFAGWGNRAYKEWHMMPGASTAHGQTYAVFARKMPDHPVLVTASPAAYIAQNPGWVDLEDIYTWGTYSWDRSVKLERPEDLRVVKIAEATARNAPNAGLALVKALKGMGLEKAKIGLDPENLSPPIRGVLSKELSQADIRDAIEVIHFIRMIKSSEEVSRLARASQVNEDARLFFLENLAPGKTENEMLQTYKEYLVKHGATFEFCNCPAGARCGATASFEPSDYMMRKGDMMWYDFGCIVNHYHADLGNNAVIGPPSKEQKDMYEVAVEGTQTALDKIQIGVKPSEVGDAVSTVFQKHGYEPIRSNVMHGIGLEIRDYPYQAPVNPTGVSDGFVKPTSTDTPLEENMVINVEMAYLQKLGFGGAQVEHTLRVTKAGYEFVCQQPREFYVVPT